MVNEYVSSMNFNNYKNGVINSINSNGLPYINSLYANNFSQMGQFSLPMQNYSNIFSKQDSFIGWNASMESFNGKFLGKDYAELFGWKKDGWTTSSNTAANTATTNTPNYESLASTNIGMTFHNHKITSGFGLRKQPIAGASTNHQGVDLAYSNNEQIGSFTNGTVIETGYNSGYGNYVLVKDDKGNVHRYAHANSVTVREGDVIKTGQVIAKAGSTGVSTGTHLHYDITNSDGRKINPVNFHHC